MTTATTNSKKQIAAAAEAITNKFDPKYVVAVGVDDGYYGIKVAVEPGVMTHHPITGHELGPDEVVRIYVPSRIVTGRVTAGDNADAGVYVHGGSTYSVVSDDFGGKAHELRTMDYAHSFRNAILVHHALISAGLAGRKLKIVTGLPVSNYYDKVTGKRSDAYVDKKINFLLDANNAPAPYDTNIVMPEIVEHDVMSEAVAGYYESVFNLDGSIANAELYDLIQQHPFVVWDIGGNTFDAATIRPGGIEIDVNQSFSEKFGGLHIESRVQDSILKMLREAYPKMPRDYQFTRDQLEKAVRTKKIFVFGKNHDVSELVAAEVNAEVRQIINSCEHKLIHLPNACQLKIIGGSVRLMKEALIEACVIEPVIPAEPEFSNANGMLIRALLAPGVKKAPQPEAELATV